MVGEDYKEFSILSKNVYGFIKTIFFQSMAHTRTQEGTEGTWRIILAGSETNLKPAASGAGWGAVLAQCRRFKDRGQDSARLQRQAGISMW